MKLAHLCEEGNTKTTHAGSLSFQVGVSVLGASLTANTKYLIVARCISFNTATTTGQIQVNTDDDSDIATQSRALVEQTTAGSSYSFVRSYRTDRTPADVALRWIPQTGGAHQIDQMSLLLIDLDALGNDLPPLRWVLRRGHWKLLTFPES